jgi:hypothetical protein
MKLAIIAVVIALAYASADAAPNPELAALRAEARAIRAEMKAQRESRSIDKARATVLALRAKRDALSVPDVTGSGK